MADTPDTILLARLQGTGDNVNLWGGYLNTALQTITRASKGYQALAVTGDATISWSNYSASNDGSVANLKLTGALTAAATLTFPNYMQNINVWNATTGGFAVTIKCSGQTGVSIPNGRKVALFCNGTDFLGAAPGYISDTITLTNDGDIVTKTTLESAIATAALPATSGTVLNSAADTTAGYLNSKVTVSGALSKSTTNSGANEALNLTVGTATTSAAGVVELATTAETQTGTDTERATTPAAVKAVANAGRAIIMATAI